MAGTTMYDAKGRILISQPSFVIEHDLVTNGNFDGTATTPIYFDAAQSNQYLEDGSKPRKIRFKFGSGFVFAPDTAGDHEVLTYEAYRDNNCTIDDNYKTVLRGLPAGVYNETRVIKVYNNGTSTNINIGV